MLGVEQGYIAPSASALRSASDVDRAGVRVGVTKGSTSERELTALLKSATLVPAPTLAAGREMLSEGKIDAYATNKAILFEMAANVRGTRVLEGRYGLESFAIGVPKGRDAGLPWLRRFATEALADGTVDKAVERAGLKGATRP
jgi:polar amino acid transport system substrate-binding protein